MLMIKNKLAEGVTIHPQLSHRRGISLIEVIVVVAIIGILSTVATVSYKGYHQKSRNNIAKHTLNSLITFAETYKANTGFVLPNLEKMNFPIQGELAYSYKIVCRDEDGKPLWHGGDDLNAKTCGHFTHHTDDSKVSDADSHTCWMGYVLYHHYFKEKPAYYPLKPVPTSDPPGPGNEYFFKCKGDAHDSQYPARGQPYPNVVAFPEHDANPYPITSVEEMFKIKEPTFDSVVGTLSPTGGIGGIRFYRPKEGSMCHLKIKGVGKKSLYAWSTDNPRWKCWHLPEFAMETASIIKILREGRVHEDFISNPHRLVITAVGCNKRETDGCQNDGSTGDDYTWLRMASDTKILTICSGQPDQTTGACGP